MKWIKNKVGAVKPCGECLLYTTGKHWGNFVLAKWCISDERWQDTGCDDTWLDEEISHIALLEEPK
jgi:hypothetical protein